MKDKICRNCAIDSGLVAITTENLHRAECGSCGKMELVSPTSNYTEKS